MNDAAFLHRRRSVIKQDLAMKFEAEDWHGMADAAMDLREIDAMLSVLPRVNPEPPDREHITEHHLGAKLAR